MKKIFHSLLVLLCTAALLCGATLPAFAEGAPTAGSITINNAVDKETYDIYRIFDLESYTTGENGKYSYTLSKKWADAGFGTADAFTTYFELENGYVHPKKGYTDATAADFAVKALAFATEHHITHDGSTVAANKTASFSNLTLGYYLVDTSLGTLCSLDTTNPNATIIEKNTAPTIDKNIVENNQLVTENNATIGSKINYQVTIHARKGATGYVLTDTLSAGLTLDKDSIVVKKGNDTLTAGVGTYTAETAEHSLTITFHQALLDTMTNDTNIVVTYSATLNKNAVIHGDVNTNKAQLKYGNNSKTIEQSTKTHTYKFDLVKTDASNTLLAGAKFKLYDSEKGGKEIPLVKLENDNHTYRPAVTGETGVEIETLGDKVITIQGLANGTYWLEETQHPAGYNKLTERKSVTLKDGNNTANMNGTTTYNPENNGGVHIVNQSGTVLPGTGGMGTTLFYIVGGGLMVAAFVLLIAKKRMENKD